jgi:hypothetical protein
MCLVAAAASWMRGGKFVHAEAGEHLTVARSHRQDRPSPSARGNGHGAGTGRAASSRDVEEVGQAGSNTDASVTDDAERA